MGFSHLILLSVNTLGINSKNVWCSKILNDLSEFSTGKTIVANLTAQNMLKIWSILLCHGHKLMCLISAELK